jgi:uncharacterized protein
MIDNTLLNIMLDYIRDKNLERFSALIEKNRSLLLVTTVFGTWLHYAAKHSSLEIVKYLILQGVDVNTHCDNIGSSFTPIQAAVNSGDVNMVRYLISHGAIIGTSKSSIENILFAATHQGHLEIIQLLIDSGIDVKVKYNSETMKNTDALALAYEYGKSDDILSLLRSHSLGEPVFWHGQRYFISPVIDENYLRQGWRRFDFQGNRLGTYDLHNKRRIGD